MYSAALQGKKLDSVKELNNKTLRDQDVKKESVNEWKKPETEPEAKQTSIITEVSDVYSDCDGIRKVKSCHYGKKNYFSFG